MTPSIKQSWPYVTLALVTYLVFLISEVPAAWVGQAVSRASQGKARLLGASGSIWNGSGTLVFNPGTGSAIQDRIQWNLQPFWLMTGQVRAAILAEGDIAVKGQLALGFYSLRAIEFSAEMPASHAQVFFAPAMLVSPTGKITLSAADVSIGKSGFDGELRLTWTDAGSKLGAAGNLGDYQMVATGKNGPAGIRVETTRGDLGVTAQGSWQLQSDGTLTLDGEIVPGNREPALAPLLAAANIAKSGNRYPWRVNYRVPLPSMLTGRN